jgi:hypothetical protein
LRVPRCGAQGIGSLLPVCALILAVLADSAGLRGLTSRCVGAVAIVAVLVAVPLTHFVVGKERHARAGFAAWQPMVGGRTYILLQSVGWGIYALSLLAAVVFALNLNQDKPHLSRLVTMTGLFGVVSQGLVLLSLSYFDARLSSTVVCSARFRSPGSITRFDKQDWRQLNYKFQDTALTAFIIFFVYMTPFTAVGVTGSVLFLPSVLTQHGWAVTLVLILIYITTYRGSPHHSGSRAVKWFRGKNMLFTTLERFFSGRLVGAPQLRSDKPYMFGFHPHGIYPLTCFWLTRGEQWSNIYPDITVDVLGASVMFYAPYIRDVLMWAGARDVSRKSIVRTLSEKRSVMLVPGGQREMRLCNPSKDSMILSTKHKGFIRLALQQGVDLVPTLSLGEEQLLQNIHAPAMQEWTTKWIGFGLPMWVHGRWFCPFPNPQCITVAMADPIHTSDEPIAEPSPELIDDVHKRYYSALRELFEKHKAEAGFEGMQLIFADDEALNEKA